MIVSVIYEVSLSSNAASPTATLYLEHGITPEAVRAKDLPSQYSSITHKSAVLCRLCPPIIRLGTQKQNKTASIRRVHSTQNMANLGKRAMIVTTLD